MHHYTDHLFLHFPYIQSVVYAHGCFPLHHSSAVTAPTCFATDRIVAMTIFDVESLKTVLHIWCYFSTPTGPGRTFTITRETLANLYFFLATTFLNHCHSLYVCRLLSDLIFKSSLHCCTNTYRIEAVLQGKKQLVQYPTGSFCGLLFHTLCIKKFIIG